MEALRSGLYVQGRGKLGQADNDGVIEYCCLGVACELAHEDGVTIEREVSNDLVVFDGVYDLLPPAVQLWLGVADEDPEVAVDGKVRSINLSTLNDDAGLNFDQIADIIEKNFLDDEGKS